MLIVKNIFFQEENFLETILIIMNSEVKILENFFMRIFFTFDVFIFMPTYMNFFLFISHEYMNDI